MDRTEQAQRAEHVTQAPGNAASELRRRLLRGLLALPLLAGCRGIGAAPVVADTGSAISRKRGSARVDVRDKGARGDGKHDDTDAFQAAVDALPDAGGTVLVPDGTYLIDPVRSVRLRDRMHLALSPGATLVAKPNAVEKAYVLLAYKVGDVEVSGGRIVGDRDRHLDTKGEWGHGIQVRGARQVTIRDIRISRCWGDGICLGGANATRSHPAVTPSTDIVVSRVVCTGNRRQGLTIGRCQRVRVFDSEFSDTSGTAPECGIDVEPDKPSPAGDVLIERCRIRGNRGPGIQLYKRVSNVRIIDCAIESNRSYGILADGAADAVIADNRINGNRRPGIGVKGGARQIRVSANSFRANATDVLHGSRWKGHVEVRDDTDAIQVDANNRFE